MAHRVSETRSRQATGPRLTTSRLVLTPVRVSDAGALCAHWNTREVRRHLWDDQPVQRAAVGELVTASDDSFRSAGYGLWALRPADHGVNRAERLVGACGLREVAGRLNQSPRNPATEAALVEILYSLAPDACGRGLAQEAGGAVLAYAFEQLELPQVVGSADAGNLASQRLLRRLGMRPLGTVTIDGMAYPYLALRRVEWVRRPTR